MGVVLIYVGQAEEALAWFKRAREVDPYFDPPWYWRSMGQAHMVLHQYKEALAMFEHLPTRQYRIAALMAGCHARLADMDRARASVAECLATKPDFSVGRFMRKEPFKGPSRCRESGRIAAYGRPAGLISAGLGIWSAAEE